MDWPTVVLTLGSLLIILGAVVAYTAILAARRTVETFTEPIRDATDLWTSKVVVYGDEAREEYEKERGRIRREHEEGMAAMRERHSRWTFGEDRSPGA